MSVEAVKCFMYVTHFLSKPWFEMKKGAYFFLFHLALCALITKLLASIALIVGGSTKYHVVINLHIAIILNKFLMKKFQHKFLNPKIATVGKLILKTH